MMLGRIDEVDGHYVATKFVALAIPLKCVYVARETPRTTQPGGTDGVHIRTDWRSIVLAYARVWFPIVAVVLPVVQSVGDGIGAVPIATWILSAALLVSSAVAHRTGALPEADKQRLRVLGTVTGLRIDPARLHPSMREVKRESLGDLMDKGGIPVTPDGIVSVIDDIPLPALPLVYGYARYAGDSPEWMECAELVYARHEQADL